MLGPFATASRRTPPNFTLPFTRCRYCRTPPADRCPQQHQRQQRQRVTERTTMTPWNGPYHWRCMCMLYNCLEWYKWVLTNLYHDGQLYNTHSTAARVASGRPTNLRLYFTLEWIRDLTLRYTTPDIHCRHRRHKCDGEIGQLKLQALTASAWLAHCPLHHCWLTDAPSLLGIFTVIWH